MSFYPIKTPPHPQISNDTCHLFNLTPFNFKSPNPHLRFHRSTVASIYHLHTHIFSQYQQHCYIRPPSFLRFPFHYMLFSMTAVKNSSANDHAVSVNDAVAGDFRDRTTMTSLKVLKEIEMDQESNASSSEDMEFYSPKSVVAKKWPVAMKEVNVSTSRGRVYNPILRIRAEDSQIGEDIGECFSKLDGTGNGNGNDRVDVVIFSRPASPLSRKPSSSSIKSDH